MPYRNELVARVDNRVREIAYYASLITIGTLWRGQFAEKDIILYRYVRCCNVCSAGKYEMIRFCPRDRGRAFGFFPNGPPHRHNGSPWIETTDWLAPVATMILPVRDGGLQRVSNYPEENIPPYFM